MAGGGDRLDRFLARLAEEEDESPLLGLSRTRLQKLIDDGAVCVETRPAKRSQRLFGGEIIDIDLPPPVPSELLAEALDLEILYEDSDLVVLNKPAGMVVHPGAGHSSGTLVHGLLHHCQDLSGIGGAKRPGIVHRLDRGTSGVMVVAKNDRAHEGLATQFAARQTAKHYVTFVLGVPAPKEQTIDTYYGRHPVHRRKFTSKLTCGKQALTQFKTALVGGGLAKLDVVLGTGRTHQIRVHLADMGHPVVGDPLYGALRPRNDVDPGLWQLAVQLDHQALHAASLGFTHPISGLAMHFQAPLPADLEALSDAISRLAA